MLSTYSILKPPKTGNCTILKNTDSPKITISDLNEIFASKESIREYKIKQLKSRLDSLIKEDRWEVDDIFDKHNYYIVPTRDSITYYICGYLLWQIIKRTTCVICLSAFKEGTNNNY